VSLPTKVRGIALSVVAIIAATSALTMDEAKWDGPVIAMADFGYLAWPVVRIALLAAALAVAVRHSRVPQSLMIRPLTATLLLFAAVQWFHPLGFPVIDIALVMATFGSIGRAYFQVRRHREELDLLSQWLIVPALGLTTGWLTVVLISAIGEWIWSFADLRAGGLATAWQAALLVVFLLLLGFGIEQTLAHPSYAIAVLWGISAMTIGASDNADTTLMIIAIVVGMLTVALYFIERAMFRFRARPGQPDAR
jgi:hypothetical protein